METRFTEGRIYGPLLRFTLPVLLANFLQAMYGAVDLLIVGRFGTAADVSAVSTGSQTVHTLTMLVVGVAMGTTVLIGQELGRKRPEEAGDAVGTSILLFSVMAIALTALMTALSAPLARLMQAPEEAFDKTVSYIFLCSMGFLFIVFYNLLGSVFRGLGDSRTPLITVAIACAVNIAGDLLLVAVLDMGAAGAALATVAAQGVSVLLSLLLIKRRGLPFRFTRENLRFKKRVAARILRLGVPIAMQDLLVSVSFLVILAIVNSLGVVASAGVGVAEKLCMFIMLVPSAFSQALSAFTAQNIGASRPARAKRALLYSMLTAFACGTALGYLAFFHGGALARIFSGDAAVVAAAADYLRAYAVDTLIVPFMFCFAGYFSGCGRTSFVMLQGVAGAFLVRIPVSYLMSRSAGASLFRIGLATPCSSVVQLVLLLMFYVYCERRRRLDGDARFASLPVD
ncbi:MAG: MATE family efflux transporter [Clostridia bacterium]|nr:MATE family efflux transporter [Clostridia bacterium]